MIPSHKVVILILTSLGIAGCASTANSPLVFVQTQTIGITANASGSQATPELTFGYRDLDVAIVPVTANGEQIMSVQPPTKQGQTTPYRDALSVLGQFNASATAGTSPNANLGKFFATGAAASRIASGFQNQLSKASPTTSHQ
jgi:hypothetical protein